MNILTAPLPESIMVNGKEHKINTDFKVWIEIESTFLNDNISDCEKIVRMLKMCYKTLPDSLSDALYAMMSFYLMSPYEDDKTNKKHKKENVKVIYSFDEDAPYIYSAFLSEYGIDLTKENLHWWQFMSLLKGLGDENKFCKIITWRAIDINEIKDKSQKKFIRKMKNIYRLKNVKTGDMAQEDIIKTLEHLF
jgi:hypothetical protein